MKIPATIGVLTYNSEKNLARCLASISDFAEIVVADGGSTDATLQIAHAADARVIPQSNPGHAITDFSRERNLTLSAASQPWFFYLDSDEIMSQELIEHIRSIASDASHPYGAYRVRYLKTNADASKIYRTYREYYQIRLVRTDVGAHFERPVHEHLEIPKGVATGQTEAPWYVPLDSEYLSLRVFAKKAWTRTRAEAASWRPNSVKAIFLGIIGIPGTRIAKSIFKMVAVKIRYGNSAIPVRYELLRILYSCFLSLRYAQSLIRGRTSRPGVVSI
ncbi:MAG: glycosyltransferase family 2 protein [Candidatus Paceibacteria bacterium]